jgi:hypothetical protein
MFLTAICLTCGRPYLRVTGHACKGPRRNSKAVGR